MVGICILPKRILSREKYKLFALLVLLMRENSLRKNILFPSALSVIRRRGSMRVVTFKIEEDLLELIDEYAELRGETRSEVIRKALIELIRGEREKIRRAKAKKIRVII